MKMYLSSIEKVNEDLGREVKEYIDSLTKPIGSLGHLEDIAIEIAKIKHEKFPSIMPPGVLVFAADHGITQEGVSAFPMDVTEQMVRNFLQGGAAINVFSREIGAYLDIIDIGVAKDIDNDQLINKKVRYGTANFYQEDAMTYEEAEKAIELGYEQALKIINSGAKCLILGEMGIGNTTASSAILAVISKLDITKLVGIGTGVTKEGLAHKAAIIKESINRRQPNQEDPIDILAKVGGLEIAGMTGAMLAAASKRIPILIDGFICTVAAVLAKKLSPNVVDYMIVTHKSAEPGHNVAVSLLGKKPILDLGLRLGEGTGAAVAYPIIKAATLMIKEMATFQSAGISSSE